MGAEVPHTEGALQLPFLHGPRGPNPSPNPSTELTQQMLACGVGAALWRGTPWPQWGGGLPGEGLLSGSRAEGWDVRPAQAGVWPWPRA